MKKLVVLGAGAFAAISMAVMGAAGANATIDVTGLTYAKAASILKSQGYKAVFGGSVGHDLPQSECIVTDQTDMSGNLPFARVKLQLDCTEPSDEDLELNEGGPKVGSNGVTTVTATPVAPPPPAG